MYNGNKTWHILRSISIKKTSKIVFKMTYQKLNILQKCPDFTLTLCFFNYTAINDNKTTNN